MDVACVVVFGAGLLMATYCGFTVTVAVDAVGTPWLFTIIALTTYVPALVKRWAAVMEEEVAPSPKLMATFLIGVVGFPSPKVVGAKKPPTRMDCEVMPTCADAGTVVAPETVIATVLEKLFPEESQPLMISVCAPLARVRVVFRLVAFTVEASTESTYTCIATTGKPEKPLATTCTDDALVPAAGLLTITSGALIVTVVVAVEVAPDVLVTLAVTV